MISALKNFLGFGITVESLAEKFLIDRQRLNLRPATMKAYRNATDLAKRRWPDRRAASITPDDMRQLLTRHGFYTARRVRAVFLWGVAEGYLQTDPAAKVLPRRRGDEAQIKYLAPVDAHYFLAEVRPEFCAAFALALFAGIRPFELSRIDWSVIHVAEKQIKIPPFVGKTGGRTFDGLPEILWATLAPLSKNSGPVIDVPVRESVRSVEERRYDAMINERARAAKAAGVSLSPDIFRHSFATYYIALRRDPGPAARVMGHCDLKMLRAHYDGMETRANAILYFREEGVSS